MRRPSGDHAGSSALRGVPVGKIRTRRVLEATIAIRPPVMYAMRRPSGAQSGEKLAAPRVSLRATFEERLMTQIWIWPPRELRNARRLPSGDQSGSSSFAMGVRRSGVALPPAAGTIHRSKFVADERRKTIRRPSGDHVGSPSPGLVVSRRARLPFAFITRSEEHT